MRWASNQGKQVDISFHEFLKAQDAVDRKKATTESNGMLLLTPAELKRVEECKDAKKAARMRTSFRRRKVLSLHLTCSQRDSDALIFAYADSEGSLVIRFAVHTVGKTNERDETNETNERVERTKRTNERDERNERTR